MLFVDHYGHSQQPLHLHLEYDNNWSVWFLKGYAPDSLSHGEITGLSKPWWSFESLRDIRENTLFTFQVKFPGYGRSILKRIHSCFWMIKAAFTNFVFSERKLFFLSCAYSVTLSLLGHCGRGTGSRFWAPTHANIAFGFEWNQEILLKTKNIQDLCPSTAIHCNKEGFNKHLSNSNYVPSTVLR